MAEENKTAAMQAKYGPYPAYHPSNTEWLGDIPEGWLTIQIGRLFRRVKRTGFIDKELLSVYRDYGVVPKSSRDDNNNKASEDLSPYQLVKKNDLVLNKMKTWQGSIAVSNYEGIVSPAYFVYEPEEKLFEAADPKYVHFLVRNPMYVAQYLRRSKGIRVSQWDLDPGEFQRIELLLPSIPEQAKIAAFLDHETAKIDALIAKQQRLIALLEEKRQAVISHAVTKGLNPDAPLRPSGIDWLGEVPAHWEVKKLKHLADFIDGDRSSAYPSDGDILEHGVPFVSSKNIVNFRLTQKNLNFISESKFSSLGRGKLIDQDLVITVRGTIGHVAKFDADIIGFKTGFINAQMTIIRPQFVPADYLLFLSESNIWKAQLDIAAYGSTVRQLSNPILGNLDIALPPDDELNSILEYLQAAEAKFDELTSFARTGSDLLKERRTALISAAVTGKIDLRDWHPSEGSTEISTEDGDQPNEALA